MNNFNYTNLTPFKWFVLENFPFIEADFDALTEWQLFCKLGKEMNKIITSENTLGTQVESLTNAFIELQNYVNNYFNNLDVQEEVNEKLNQMAEDGTLLNLLSSYVNIERIYTTHNELLQDANNIVNLQKIKTLGFYSLNDGGGATYIATTIQNENKYQEKIADNLYIELITENDEINVRQLGAHGDGVTDDTQFIQNALDYFTNVFLSDGTYIVSHIVLSTRQNLYGTSYKAILKNKNTNTESNLITINPNSSLIKIHDFYIEGNFENNRENVTNALSITRAVGVQDNENDPKFEVYNLVIRNATGDAIDINIKNNDSLYDNIRIINARKNGIVIDTTDVKISNCNIAGSGLTGLKLTRRANACIINNCKVFYTGFSDKTYPAVNIISDRNMINNLYIQETIGDGMWIQGSQNTLTGIVINSCGRNLDGTIYLATALALKQVDDIRYLVRDNFIEGSINNGDTNSFAKYGLTIDASYCFNNYINMLCNNIRYNTKYPQSMKKYQQNFKNFTNNINLELELIDNTPKFINGIKEAIGKSASGGMSGVATWNEDNNKLDIVINDVNNYIGQYGYGAYSGYVVPYAGTGTAPKKMIVRTKAKISNNNFKAQIKLLVTYNNGQNASLIFNKNDIFETNFSEYDDLLSYFDLSSYNNITYLSLSLNVQYISGDVSDVSQINASFKDLQIDLLY